MRMGSITTRDLDEPPHRKLRLCAAERNRSVEEEARVILRRASARETGTKGDLADAVRRLIEPLGEVNLLEFPRGMVIAGPIDELDALQMTSRK
jgi:plasmid stability protein